MPPPASTIPQALSRKRKLAPIEPAPASASASASTSTSRPRAARARDTSSSPDASETSHDPRDSEYAPSPSTAGRAAGAGAGAKRRPAGGAPADAGTSKGGAGAGGGAGVGTGGRQMSREALRKANHSLIERRRREKINAALSDLRDMVPGLGDAGPKGGEFKLEVLERTVAHMRELKDRVAELSAEMAERVGDDEDDVSEPAPRDKRKRRVPRADDGGKGDARDTEAARRASSSSSSSSPSHEKGSSSRSSTPTHIANATRLGEHGVPDAAGTVRPVQPHGRREADIDPNETESEAGLPPALTYATRSARMQSALSGSGPTDPLSYFTDMGQGSRSGVSSPSFDPAPCQSSSMAHVHSSHSHSHSHSNSPSPSLPSLAHLSHPFNGSHNGAPPPLPTRTLAPPQASNPTLYLPFPTPSPTSPFLSYTSASSSASTGTTTSNSTGPPEPSPFIAPLGGMPLFGGMLNLDAPGGGMIGMGSASTSPDVLRGLSRGGWVGAGGGGGGGTNGGTGTGSDSDSDLLAFSLHTGPGTGSRASIKAGLGSGGSGLGTKKQARRDAQEHALAGEVEVEEAANVLLAFSSPDVMRPTVLGMTSLVGPVAEVASAASTARRRATLEGEEFVLDGGRDAGVVVARRATVVSAGELLPRRGKTAREILEM